MAEPDTREGKGKDVSRRRQWISGANAGVVVLATIGIAIVANALVSQMPTTKIDMTQNNIYTLSEPSREVVEDLDEKVEVRAFISADMPKPHHTLRRSVRDKLMEYSAAAGDKLDFKVVAPEGDEQTEKTAQEYGCKKTPLSKENQLSLVYKCVAFIQGDNQEVISELKTGRGGQGNFEYDFTKALMNLTDRETRKVGFVAGFGGIVDQRGFMKRFMERYFDQFYGDLIVPTKVDLAKKDAVPEDVSALVILNPDQSFTDKAKYAIDQFIQRGGSVGWYQSATGIDRQMRKKMMRQMGRRGQMPEFRKPLETGLNDFFAEYGVELNQDLVLDPENAVPGQTKLTEQGLVKVKHPANFSVSNINRKLPFTRQLGMMVMPAPSSVTIKASARDDEDLQTFEVLKTAESAVRQSGPPESLAYKEFEDVGNSDDEETGAYVLSGALQGDLPSYYDNPDHDPPKGVDAGGDGAQGDESTVGRLLVVGSGEFFQPVTKLGFNRQHARMGFQFLLSSIEWLVQDSALGRIRGKSMPPMVGEVDETTKRNIQFINIACVPALFALIGLGMMYRRRRRRETLKWGS